MVAINNWSKDRLKVESYKEGNKVGWKVSGTLPGGGRVRKRFSAKVDAEMEVSRLAIEADNILAGGDNRFTRLSRDQEQDALTALGNLTDKLAGWSLVRAVQFCQANYAPQGWGDKTVEDASEAFIQRLCDLGRTKNYIEDNKFKCERLCRFYPGKLVADFTPKEIYEWVFSKSKKDVGPWDSDKFSKTTRSGERTFLRSFFKFCKGRKWLSGNPVDESIPSPGKNKHQPEAFTPEQAERLLKAAQTLEPEVTVPYFALGLFAAIRPDEARKLRWEDFIWRCEDGEPSTVVIDAATAKTSRRRSVELPENCVAWIKPYAKESGPLVPCWSQNLWCRAFDTVRARAGFKIDPRRIKVLDPELAKIAYKEGREKYIRDGLRHTGITYRLEVVGEIGKVALWSGNSPTVIHDHYRDIVRGGRKQVEEFYAILPVAA